MIAQGYVWYLQAFYDKEEETIIRSRDEIKELYDQCEDGKIKGYLFWLYMNLSEELMKDAKLRMELIKELYQEGCQNPLLQFEGCCILGEDEQAAYPPSPADKLVGFLLPHILLLSQHISR